MVWELQKKNKIRCVLEKGYSLINTLRHIKTVAMNPLTTATIVVRGLLIGALPCNANSTPAWSTDAPWWPYRILFSYVASAENLFNCSHTLQKYVALFWRTVGKYVNFFLRSSGVRR